MQNLAKRCRRRSRHGWGMRLAIPLLTEVGRWWARWNPRVGGGSKPMAGGRGPPPASVRSCARRQPISTKKKDACVALSVWSLAEIWTRWKMPEERGCCVGLESRDGQEPFGKQNLTSLCRGKAQTHPLLPSPAPPASDQQLHCRHCIGTRGDSIQCSLLRYSFCNNTPSAQSRFFLTQLC